MDWGTMTDAALHCLRDDRRTVKLDNIAKRTAVFPQAYSVDQDEVQEAPERATSTAMAALPNEIKISQLPIARDTDRLQ